MRRVFVTQLAVVATVTVGLCSFAQADSTFKVVTPGDPQNAPNGGAPKAATIPADKLAAQADADEAPAPDLFAPLSTIPGPEIEVAPELLHTSKTIFITPGHITRLQLDWDIKSIHVGDSNLLEITPVGARDLLVMAKSRVQDDKEKYRQSVSKSNFYVLGKDSKNYGVYEVVIENYRPRSAPPPRSVEFYNQVEIHNQKVLANSTNYECKDPSGCKLGDGETSK